MAAIDATIKAAEVGDDDDDSVGDRRGLTSRLTPAELKALKARTHHRQEGPEGAGRQAARSSNRGPRPGRYRGPDVRFAASTIAGRSRRRVAAHRQALVDRYQTWHGKYAVTLRDLEAERDAATKKLDAFLRSSAMAEWSGHHTSGASWMSTRERFGQPATGVRVAIPRHIRSCGCSIWAVTPSDHSLARAPDGLARQRRRLCSGAVTIDDPAHQRWGPGPWLLRQTGIIVYGSGRAQCRTLRFLSPFWSRLGIC